jgi:ubiquinone/menaquinone biosynthesis C-methylase UbiE
VFQQASASALPYEDGAFDLAVSNLVFHEVKDSADKREVIREALRVVRPGGRFVFQDLLKLESYFSKPEELVALIKSWGVQEVRFEDTSGAEFIPRALKLPFMVGALGMVYGVK